MTTHWNATPSTKTRLVDVHPPATFFQPHSRATRDAFLRRRRAPPQRAETLPASIPSVRTVSSAVRSMIASGPRCNIESPRKWPMTPRSGSARGEPLPSPATVTAQSNSYLRSIASLPCEHTLTDQTHPKNPRPRCLRLQGGLDFQTHPRPPPRRGMTGPRRQRPPAASPRPGRQGQESPAQRSQCPHGQNQSQCAPPEMPPPCRASPHTEPSREPRLPSIGSIAIALAHQAVLIVEGQRTGLIIGRIPPAVLSWIKNTTSSRPA